MGPQFIGPSGQTVPNQFGPHGQMVPQNLVPMDKWSPTNLVPLDKWSLEYSVCPGGQAVGTICPWGTEFDGYHLSMGINFKGIVCPGGQEVGDRKSADQMGLGPNASQPTILVFERKSLGNLSCKEMKLT